MTGNAEWQSECEGGQNVFKAEVAKGQVHCLALKSWKMWIVNSQLGHVTLQKRRRQGGDKRRDSASRTIHGFSSEDALDIDGHVAY